MLEPLPSNLSAFHTVQLLAALYLLLGTGITTGLVVMGMPMEAAVYVFILVLVVLGVPFFILVRTVHPDPPTL